MAQTDIVRGFYMTVTCLSRNLEVLSSKLGREPVILRGIFVFPVSQDENWSKRRHLKNATTGYYTHNSLFVTSTDNTNLSFGSPLAFTYLLHGAQSFLRS
jgi:hypothetical protein